MIRAGRLTRTVTLEERTVTVSPAGTRSEAWAPIAQVRAEHPVLDKMVGMREELRQITPRWQALKTDPNLTPMQRARALQRWKEAITR